MPDTPDLPSSGEVLLRPRPPRGWRERLEQLADATGTTPLRIAGGGVVALVAVAFGVWLLRPAPAPPEVALPYASTTAVAAGPTTSTEAAVLVVHVAGAVTAPGVHELAPGARVTDAIDAAGGLRPDADSARINLAAPVVDGERVYLPVVGEEAPPIVVGGAPTAGGDDEGTPGLVNLNTADPGELEELPGVGPATAAAIIGHREEIGGFTAIDELLDVPGIGETKLEQLRPLVTV